MATGEATGTRPDAVTSNPIAPDPVTMCAESEAALAAVEAAVQDLELRLALDAIAPRLVAYRGAATRRRQAVLVDVLPEKLRADARAGVARVQRMAQAVQQEVAEGERALAAFEELTRDFGDAIPLDPIQWQGLDRLAELAVS